MQIYVSLFCICIRAETLYQMSKDQLCGYYAKQSILKVTFLKKIMLHI